nr:hypothetical protein [uncultured Bacteroides sp.]
MADLKLGNVTVSNMYLGNAPINRVYQGNTLVWEKSKHTYAFAGNHISEIIYDAATDSFGTKTIHELDYLILDELNLGNQIAILGAKKSGTNYDFSIYLYDKRMHPVKTIFLCNHTLYTPDVNNSYYGLHYGNGRFFAIVHKDGFLYNRSGNIIPVSMTYNGSTCIPRFYGYDKNADRFYTPGPGTFSYINEDTGAFEDSGIGGFFKSPCACIHAAHAIYDKSSNTFTMERTNTASLTCCIVSPSSGNSLNKKVYGYSKTSATFRLKRYKDMVLLAGYASTPAILKTGSANDISCSLLYFESGVLKYYYGVDIDATNKDNVVAMMCTYGISYSVLLVDVTTGSRVGLVELPANTFMSISHLSAFIEHI